MKEYVGVRRTMGVRKVVLRGEISKQKNMGMLNLIFYVCSTSCIKKNKLSSPGLLFRSLKS